MPILGTIASGISGHLSVPSDYESIQTINITNGSTTVANFTSIPSTYKSLYLRVIFSSNSSGGEAFVSYNGDTTAGNYSRQVMYNTGSGTGVSFVQNSQANGRSYLYSPDNVTNYPYTFPVYNHYIPDYALTNKYKSIWQDGYQNIQSTLGAIVAMSGLWASTAAINQITFTMQSGAYFAPNSQLALFGLK
jgi:hypothetical protein